MENGPGPPGPQGPLWLEGVATLLFNREFESAWADPEKTLAAHYELAEQGLGI